MTAAALGAVTSRLVRHAVATACRCAGHRWKVDVSRSFAGVSVRAEVRSH